MLVEFAVTETKKKDGVKQPVGKDNEAVTIRSCKKHLIERLGCMGAVTIRWYGRVLVGKVHTATLNH